MFTALFRNVFQVVESALEVADSFGSTVVDTAAPVALSESVSSGPLGVVRETTALVADLLEPDSEPELARNSNLRLNRAVNAGGNALAASRLASSQQGDSPVSAVVGDAGSDALFSGVGRYSRLLGDAGDDYIVGNSGNDWLYGQADDDAIFGGAGIDYLYGGLGDDLLDGGTGDDWLTGNLGADAFVLRPGDGNDLIWDYQDGIDAFRLEGGLGIGDVEAVAVPLGNTTWLRVIGTQEILATLVGVNSGVISSDDFFAV